MVKLFLNLLKKNDRGASMIEFAIVTPLLLIPLVVGIIEFGWIYNGYISLNGATREGARVASIYKVLPGDDEYNDYIISEVKKHATNTLEINDIRVIPVEVGVNPHKTKGVRVEADGRINLLFGGIPFFPVHDPFNVTAQTTMSLELD